VNRPIFPSVDELYVRYRRLWRRGQNPEETEVR